MQIFDVSVLYQDTCGNSFVYEYGRYWAENKEQVELVFPPDGWMSSWFIEECKIDSLPSVKQKRPSLYDMENGRIK